MTYYEPRELHVRTEIIVLGWLEPAHTPLITGERIGIYNDEDPDAHDIVSFDEREAHRLGYRLMLAGNGIDYYDTDPMQDPALKNIELINILLAEIPADQQYRLELPRAIEGSIRTLRRLSKLEANH